MQRLERIDAAWAGLVRGEATPDTEAELLRDVHTLKGDAKVVGLGEASVLCQRLEDLLSLARERRYNVHDDVDIVVTMSIQFLGMLVRKQSSARGGIDIAGFMQQVEQVTSLWLTRSPDTAGENPLAHGPHLRVKDHARMTASRSARLSSATTAVFLEHLRSVGEPRERVRRCWLSLVEGVNDVCRTSLSTLLAVNATMARELAVDLGKRVEVRITGAEAAVTPETVDALGVLAVHALRNAVDHGIELPAIRIRAGKPAAGVIRITVSREGERVRLVVSDDGAGIDVERVRGRAVERGLLSEEVATHASAAQISEVLFAPGFSTREATTATSGRGIGLDAAHEAMTSHGGSLRIEHRAGGGTSLIAEVPDIRGTLQVVTFEGGASSTRFAVPAGYALQHTTTATPDVVLEDLLGLPMTAPKGEAALEISWGMKKLVLSGRGTLAPHRAWRQCPTADSELVEVLWIGGDEVLLVRPEVLHASVAAS
jgi:two-component system chemotaxis sensor kinase CheA